MPSPSSLCASCLRAAQRTTTVKRVATRSSFFPASPRAYTTVSPAAQSLRLDFLVSSSPIAPKRPLLRCTTLPPTATPTTRRPLATAASSTSQPAQPEPAHAILHPRTTDSGEPMRLSLSPRAAHRLSTISNSDNNPSLALRVSIESGGCHGFQYLMNLVDLSKSPATEEDTVFQGDRGAKLVVDEASLELLNGSTIDYTMELIGSQFKVTGIPGATSSCGCGTSFDIKI